MWNKLLLLGVLLAPLAAAAQPAPESFDCRGGPSIRWIWDPCRSSTAAAELHLPLPGGLFLVFRPVDVRGTDFWCDEGRNVPLGHVMPNDPFARVQTVQVGGAFPTATGWRYFIAKYELTLGQAAAILGEGSLQAGLVQLLAMLRRDAGGAQMARELAETLARPDAAGDWKTLAEPLRGLTASEVAELFDRLNLWCFRDEACTKLLRQRAHFATIPGFVRLPTEIEWEYAARGGLRTRDEARFQKDRPWDSEAEHYRFAVSRSSRSWPGKGPVRIGGERLPNPGGLFDTLGNVRELTADLFSVELRQGRTGALSARGGSRDDTAAQLSFGLRAEAPIYRWDAADRGDGPAVFKGLNRDITLGVRPVLAGVNVPTPAYMREATEKAKSAEGAACRRSTPAGASASTADSSTKKVADLLARMDELVRGERVSRDRLEAFQREFEALRTQVNDTRTRYCSAQFRNLYNLGRGIGADIVEARRLEVLVANMDILAADAQRPTDVAYYRDQAAHYRAKLERLRSLTAFGIASYRQAVEDSAQFDPRCRQADIEGRRAELNRMRASQEEWAILELVERHMAQASSGRFAPVALAGEFSMVMAAGSTR